MESYVDVRKVVESFLNVFNVKIFRKFVGKIYFIFFILYMRKKLVYFLINVIILV